jgi:hypothetical protein
MKTKFRIKHKEEGWTGVIEVYDLETNSFSSHKCSGKIEFIITQDAYDENEKYHEDPDVESLNELEFLD